MSLLRIVIGVLTLVGILDAAGMPAAQSFREIARHFGPRADGTPIAIPSSPADHWPKPIEEVAREAAVVLRAKLSRTKSYLAPSEDRILTDYEILGPQVVVGHLSPVLTQTPGPLPLTLTVWGGDAVVEGVPMRSVDVNMRAITDGGEYLLFLRQARLPGPGRYEIYYGAIFEVSQDRLEPLLRNASAVFKGTTETGFKELVARIEKAR